MHGALEVWSESFRLKSDNWPKPTAGTMQ